MNNDQGDLVEMSGGPTNTVSDYQAKFTALLLQACNQAHQVAQIQQSSSALQVPLRDRLVEELLRVGADSAGIQQVLSGCAAAVLKVGQALQGALQQQFVQRALQALQDAPEVLISSSRDAKLVQLLQSAATNREQLQALECYGSWVHTCPEAAQVVYQMSGTVDSQP